MPRHTHDLVLPRRLAREIDAEVRADDAARAARAANRPTCRACRGRGFTTTMGAGTRGERSACPCCDGAGTLPQPQAAARRRRL